MHPKHNMQVMKRADLPAPICWNHSEVYRKAEQLAEDEGLVVSDLTQGQAFSIYSGLKNFGFSVRRRVQNPMRGYHTNEHGRWCRKPAVYQAIITREKSEWELALEHDMVEDEPDMYNDLGELKKALEAEEDRYERRQPKFIDSYAWTSQSMTIYIVDFTYYPITQHVVLTRVHNKRNGMYGDPEQHFRDVMPEYDYNDLIEHLVEDQTYLHS